MARKGGCPFRRGTLYHLLANRIYRGEIVHKGDVHPGEHEAIVPQPLWDEVQAKLAQRGPGRITKRGPNRSLLTGLIHDGLDRPMTPSHAVVRSRRYRYYVTRDASAGGPAWRVGAHDLERLVAARFSELLLERGRIARMVAAVDPRRVESAVAAAAEIATRGMLLGNAPALGIRRIKLGEDRVGVVIDERGCCARAGSRRLPTMGRRSRWRRRCNGSGAGTSFNWSSPASHSRRPFGPRSTSDIAARRGHRGARHRSRLAREVAQGYRHRASALPQTAGEAGPAELARAGHRPGCSQGRTA